MENENMPRVDLAKDAPKLTTSDLHWMKQVEKENIERVIKYSINRKKKFIVGSLLGAGVLGIYSYTLFAIKQEKYFEDFEYPETESKEGFPPLPSIQDILKLYRLQAKKQLAQNFLMNERLTNKIVRQAGNLHGAQVIEVGPGPGGLTRSIIKRFPAKLTVIEKDERFKPTLQMLAESFAMVNGKMDITFDDILKIHMEILIPEDRGKSWDDKCPRIIIIGNLPFNVSIPLIINWLHAICEKRGPWSMGRVKLLLTFQKEIAERLVAEPGGRQRSRLSVMAQAWTKPRLRFIIPGKAFVPAPDVDVGVVSFEPLIIPRTDHDFKLFDKITRQIFSFRNKYSKACVKTLFPSDVNEDMSLMMFKLADLDPTTRPTKFSVEDIHRLCSAYKYLVDRHPGIEDYEYRASRKILSKCHTSNLQVEDIEDFNHENGYEPPDTKHTEVFF